MCKYEQNIISVDGLTREEARNFVMSLKRNKKYLVYVYKYPDGRLQRIFIETRGRKSRLDFKIYYETDKGKLEGFSYIEDVLVDVLQKKEFVTEELIKMFIDAVKDSIELKSLNEIKHKYPDLFSHEMYKLPGHPIELLLILLKWAGIQEDVNYWGINPRTKKPYEGRYKPLNALKDLFIHNIRLSSVLRKHRLCK